MGVSCVDWRFLGDNMLKETTFLIVALATAVTASAQVYKCPDKATGRIVYSDAACDDGQQIVKPTTPEERALNAERAALARERLQLDMDRAELRKEQQQDASAAEAPPPSAATPPIDHYACQKAKRELSISSNLQTESPEGKRQRMNAAIVEVNAACGTRTELIQEPARVTVVPRKGQMTTEPRVH